MLRIKKMVRSQAFKLYAKQSLVILSKESYFSALSPLLLGHCYYLFWRLTFLHAMYVGLWKEVLEFWWLHVLVL